MAVIKRPESRYFSAGVVVKVLSSLVLVAASPEISIAQQMTSNPGDWRPLVHADLRTENPDNLTYIDVWKDVIAANNRAYDVKGSARTAGENAPATDAHVVIRSGQRAIVLSTLNTAAGCQETGYAKAGDLALKLCPTRLVIFDGPVSKSKDLPASCYLEVNAAATLDPNAAGSYVAYDTVTKTIKLGVVLDHKPIDECARFISVSQ